MDRRAALRTSAVVRTFVIADGGMHAQYHPHALSHRGSVAVGARALFLAIMLAVAGIGLARPDGATAGDFAPAPSAQTGSEADGAAGPEQDDTFVIGTGIVIDLPGTGDSTVDERAVDQSIVGFLRRAGMDLWEGRIRPGRIAKVIVTADLPREHGAALTITLIAAGDATDLRGGTLLPTPLRRTNGAVYVVAQGTVVVTGHAATVRDPRADPDTVAVVAAGGSTAIAN